MAIRDSLIEFLPTGERELYDLRDDPGETRIGRGASGVAEAMGARLARWRAGVVGMGWAPQAAPMR